ncbi:MAG: FtsQ-type POTRA domain-containing protein [Clostridia bacterium]|nr:FtsQ-type POTRA domain-containing protein [Clostridia bacterium]
MAHKSKHAEEKNKKTKKRAVENNTAQPKKTMKTSTIEVQINQMPNQTGQPNNKNQKKIKKVQKVKPENKKNKSKLLKWFGIIGLIIVVGIFLFTTPLFNVTEIEVKGNSTVNSEEIKSLSQIKLNENIFKNIKAIIKENIKCNPYIEDVEVKRILPNKIQITVQERTVKFMLKLLDKYAYINSQGYILEITNQTREIPIIEGMSTLEEEMIVGKRLNNEDLNKLETILKIVSSCEENEISKYITSINAQNQSEYIMIFAEKGITVHLGNSTNLDTKILYVKAILQAEEGNEGDIFVNGDLNNGFQPYFRKKV